LSDHGIVAIVDDDEAVRIGLESLMRSIDVKAEVFASAESFFESDHSRFACVLSDIQMPGRSGLDLLVAVRASRPDLPVVLMTAFPDERVRERAKAAGAYRFFVKPCDPNALVDVVESLLAPPL
jgi:FixJ family two-component response regulator